MVAAGGGEMGGDLGNVVESGLAVIDNFGGQERRVGQIGRIAQAVIPEPEDIQISFVALDQVFVGEAMEALGPGALMAVLGIVAADEVVEIGAGEGGGLSR